MFINLNVIVTCFCVGGISARLLLSEVVETERSFTESGDWDALLTKGGFLTTL